MHRYAWVVVVAACAGKPVAAPPPAAPPRVVEEPSEPEGMPEGYVQVRVAGVVPTGEGDSGMVALVDDDSQRVLPVFIGGTEALSIGLRLAGDTPERPLTHDLMESVWRRLGVSLVKVQVDELREQVFIGSIFLRDGKRVFRVDARPSDAIALALGNAAPVYVARAVLDAAGIGREELERRRTPPPGVTRLGR